MGDETQRTARDWSVTLYDDEWIDKFGHGLTSDDLPARCKYMCGQVEQCPDTQRLHCQVMVRFSNPVRMGALKSIFGIGNHFEQRRGSPDELRDYTMKDESKMSGWSEVGTWNAQGRRVDLMLARQAIDSGSGMGELFRNLDTFATAVQHHRGLGQALLHLRPPQQRDELSVEVLWGPPGSGKSSSVHLREQELFLLDPPATFGGTAWWDGYDGEEAVLFDDFEGWLPWTLLLRVLDPYPVRVQTKGGMQALRAKRVYLTSNKPPEQWYPARASTYAALERRFSRIFHCEKDLWTLQMTAAPRPF